MTEAEKLTTVKVMMGGEELDRLTAQLESQSISVDELLSTYISIAGNKVLSRCYPYGDGTEEVPVKYHYVQCQVAVYMVLKRGAEGHTMMQDNGVYRMWDNADIPLTLMREVVPVAVVIGGSSDETTGA